MSNAWFRMYSEFATDPKVQSMSEALQRRLMMLFCLQCSGELETLTHDEVAFALRVDNETLHETFQVFKTKGFLDGKGRLSNWDKRQYKSDSSTDRVKKYRDKTKSNQAETPMKRFSNAEVTPPDTDTDTEADTDTERKKDSDTNVSGESSPIVDFKKVIFDQGLKFIAKGSGKPEAGLRPLVGKWVSLYGEAKVAGAIIDAQRVSAVDPIGYIQGIFSRGSPAKAMARPLSAMNYRAGTEGFDVT